MSKLPALHARLPNEHIRLLPIRAMYAGELSVSERGYGVEQARVEAQRYVLEKQVVHFPKIVEV